jgi:hypothetical protein
MPLLLNAPVSNEMTQVSWTKSTIVSSSRTSKKVPVHNFFSDMSYIDANATMPQTHWFVASQANDYLEDISNLAHLPGFPLLSQIFGVLF